MARSSQLVRLGSCMTTEPLALFAVPRSRPADQIFDALCTATGIDYHQLTTLGRGPLNRAVKELRAVGATPDQIEARAKQWARKFPNATLTPCALAKHWASLVPPVTHRAFTDTTPDHTGAIPMPANLRKWRA